MSRDHSSVSLIYCRLTFAEVDLLFEEGVSARKFKQTGEEMRRAQASMEAR